MLWYKDRGRFIVGEQLESMYIIVSQKNINDLQE